jgi:hypothetical protein
VTRFTPPQVLMLGRLGGVFAGADKPPKLLGGRGTLRYP